MTARLKIGSFLGLMIAAAVGAAALALSLPHDPYVRYQSFRGTMFDRLSWVYERLAEDPTPIDILVVGSSRSARGVNAAALEAELAARGLDLHVANVSIPASGFDSRLTLIREAVEHHEPRLVIWGLVEAFPRDGHQVFADLARPGEVAASPWLINRTLPENLARLPYRQLEYWLATSVPDAFGYQRGYDPARYIGPTPDLRDFNDRDPAEEAALVASPDHAETLAAESRMRAREIRPPILPERLAGLEFGVSRSYVAEAADLGAAEGFRLAFLFLPFYQGWDAPLEADWLSQFGPVWTAGFLKEDAANYVDAAHASDAGQALITPWLADQIVPLMTEASQ